VQGVGFADGQELLAAVLPQRLQQLVALNCTVATEWIRGLFGLDYAGVDAALAESPPGAAV